MSCGNSHDVNCREILERVHVFIDNELDTADSQAIHAHLAECGPCLDAVDLERMVKALIARSCIERAPEQLFERVRVSIRDVQATTGLPNTAGEPPWARPDSSQELTQQFNTRPPMPGV